MGAKYLLPRAYWSRRRAKRPLIRAQQGIFTARFLVQWLASERKRDSVIPVAFWWLSLFGGLALLSAGLSYLVSSGESMTWGYNAKWTRLREWKNALVRSSRSHSSHTPLETTPH